jgi:hypothetical protein
LRRRVGGLIFLNLDRGFHGFVGSCPYHRNAV